MMNEGTNNNGKGQGAMKSTIRTARIVGFFSIPSASLAEHNPAAYNDAMASIPAGAGTCSHCGTGIRHHVVIVDEMGKTRFIGQDCALKVGCDASQIRERLTDDQRRQRDVRALEHSTQMDIENQAAAEKRRAYLARRFECVGDIISMLRAQGTEFHTSLAGQLEKGPLSHRQAFYVAKSISATGRRNKKNAAAWDDVETRCMELTT